MAAIPRKPIARAARLAKGWFGFALDLDATAKCIEGLQGRCKEAGRRFEDLEMSVTPRGRIDRDSAKRFADVGVHRLILLHRQGRARLGAGLCRANASAN